jgi:hypothetical protein
MRQISTARERNPEARRWCIERLGEGIWLQTVEHFEDSGNELLQQQIVKHFQSIGVVQDFWL